MGFSNVFVRCPSSESSNRVLPASEALPQYGLKPLMLVILFPERLSYLFTMRSV